MIRYARAGARTGHPYAAGEGAGPVMSGDSAIKRRFGRSAAARAGALFGALFFERIWERQHVLNKLLETYA